MKQLAIILSVLVPIVFGQCRNGWIQNGTSCYFFSEFDHDRWSAAEYVCVTLGGYLTEVNNEMEGTFIRDRLHWLHDKDPRGNYTYYFLGASDMERDGNYKWMKSQTAVTYTDWYPGEPNNFQTREDCLGVGGRNGWHWIDMPCSSDANFICEMPVPSSGNQ